jgi:4-carboxymuconolactone decarboxylase
VEEKTSSEEAAMSTDERGLSRQEKELVALGASVGTGCHPCVDYHLEAAKKVELDDDRMRTAITTAQVVAAQAAQELAQHLLHHLDAQDLTPAAPLALDTELAGLGAALGANDRTNIERHMAAMAELGASVSQIQHALDVAHTVQTNAAAIHLRAAQRLLAELPPTETPASDASPQTKAAVGAERQGDGSQVRRAGSAQEHSPGTEQRMTQFA